MGELVDLYEGGHVHFKAATLVDLHEGGHVYALSATACLYKGLYLIHLESRNHLVAERYSLKNVGLGASFDSMSYILSDMFLGAGMLYAREERRGELEHLFSFFQVSHLTLRDGAQSFVAAI